MLLSVLPPSLLFPVFHSYSSRDDNRGERRRQCERAQLASNVLPSIFSSHACIDKHRVMCTRNAGICAPDAASRECVDANPWSSCRLTCASIIAVLVRRKRWCFHCFRSSYRIATAPTMIVKTRKKSDGNSGQYRFIVHLASKPSQEIASQKRSKWAMYHTNACCVNPSDEKLQNASHSRKSHQGNDANRTISSGCRILFTTGFTKPRTLPTICAGKALSMMCKRYA